MAYKLHVKCIEGILDIEVQLKYKHLVLKLRLIRKVKKQKNLLDTVMNGMTNSISVFPYHYMKWIYSILN